MKLKIGVVGSHRTGKTTICQELKKVFPELKLINSSVSSHPVWKQYNKSPDDVLTFKERLLIQIELIEYVTNLISINQKNDFIIDRTPIDVLGYLYCSLDSTVNKELDSEVNKLKQVVIESIQQLNTIIFINPGLENSVSNNELFVSGKNNPTFQSLIYRDALTNCMLGIINRYVSTKVIIIPEEIINLQERLEFILSQGLFFNGK